MCLLYYNSYSFTYFTKSSIDNVYSILTSLPLKIKNSLKPYFFPLSAQSYVYSSLVHGYCESKYDEIVEFVITTGKASASLLQRRFKLGYNRAARIIDLLEERGIIGPQNGSKPREVLVKLESHNDG